MKKQIPPRDLQWIDAQGKPTDQFFDFVKNMSERTLTNPVAVDEPANGDVLIFNSTTGNYEPGAN